MDTACCASVEQCAVVRKYTFKVTAGFPHIFVADTWPCELSSTTSDWADKGRSAARHLNLFLMS